MKLHRMLAAAALCGISLLGASASAGILASDGNAIAGFHGSKPFAAAVGPLSFNASVDYAVYSPGTFTTTFGAGSDPSAGAQYVYAYQMTNTGTTAQRAPDFLTVGFNGDQQPANIEALPNIFGDYGVDPINPSTFIPAAPPYTSANWNYNNATPLLPSGISSEILLYTSPNPPGFYNSSVKAGALVNTLPGALGLPSPIPEPTGAALAVLSGALLGMRRRRS
ncbi:MAG: hypothetical protein ACREJC_19075 [Tepidisphaeraceae bacterium]